MNRSLKPATLVLCLESVVVLVFAVAQRPFDLNVYVWGGHAVGRDAGLYLARVTGVWFTYPPFAAATFAPLSALSPVFTRVLWELGSIAACGLACAATLRLAKRPVSRSSLVTVLAGALLLEPVWHTLYLGQINLILLALILADMQRIATGRHAGLGIGVAAAIKLTPAIFVVLLVLTRRTRSALIAGGTFLGCGLLGFLLAPGASWLYWSRLFHDTHRVGAPYISNQSPYGALLRLTGAWQTGRQVGAWYLLISLAVGAVGLAAATVFARHDDWLAATATTGVTGLLVSPISWSHHWVWVIPALALLARGGTGDRIAGVCAAVLFAVAPPWWTPHAGDDHEYAFHGMVTLAANSYLVAGLSFLIYVAARAWKLAARPAGHGSMVEVVPQRVETVVPVARQRGQKLLRHLHRRGAEPVPQTARRSRATPRIGRASWASWSNTSMPPDIEAIAKHRPC